MEYTQNYHLPQWVKSDRIMMEDFNDAMNAMENGMTRSEGKADAALSTANDAKQTAGAAFTPNNMPYAVGTYTGNGATYRDIEVGFRPNFVIICRDQRTTAPGRGGTGVLMAGPNQPSLRLYMTDTGFRLDGSETVNPYPMVNENGITYDYIAFR